MSILHLVEFLTTPFVLPNPFLESSIYFPDFEGVLKSMGAWGGDFFMALHPDPNYTKAFFAERGYPHVYSAMDWVKHE